MTMADKYILDADGKTPIPCDLMTWAQWFEKRPVRALLRETVREGVDVSTVFLGIDHQYGDGPPLLWETMIFGGPRDGDQWRYPTYDEAMAGHEAAKAIAVSEDAPSGIASTAASPAQKESA
jgi:hypothetical protein